MTTKKFRLIEYSTDGSIFDENVYATRKEATRVIAGIMANDENADPQLFKILVEEVEVKSELDMIAEKVADYLATTEKTPIIKIEKIEPTESNPFMLATITRPQQHFLPLSSSTIKKIVEILDDWNWWIDPKGNIEISQELKNN